MTISTAFSKLVPVGMPNTTMIFGTGPYQNALHVFFQFRYARGNFNIFCLESVDIFVILLEFLISGD